jgi:hypothetical protein
MFCPLVLFVLAIVLSVFDLRIEITPLVSNSTYQRMVCCSILNALWFMELFACHGNPSLLQTHRRFHLALVFLPYSLHALYFYWKKKADKTTINRKQKIKQNESIKNGNEPMCSRRISRSCSTRATRRVTLVANPMISRECVKRQKVLTTVCSYPWSWLNICRLVQPSLNKDARRTSVVLVMLWPTTFCQTKYFAMLITSLCVCWVAQ